MNSFRRRAWRRDRCLALWRGEQQAKLLVENEQRRPFAACHGRSDVMQGQERLAGAGRADNERARSGSEAAAEQGDRIPVMPLANEHCRKVGPMLGRHETRKHPNAAGCDTKIVVAAAELLAAALDHPQAPPLAAIDRRKLVEMNDAMADAVDGTIGGCPMVKSSSRTTVESRCAK